MNYAVKVLEELDARAEKVAYVKAGEDIMIYPCGNAWVSFGRKANHKNKNHLTAKEVFGNALLGQKLEKGHLSVDPLKNIIKYHTYKYNQSLLHKEAHMEELAKLLTNEFGEEFNSNSRID